jgi:hypothetical protein
VNTLRFFLYSYILLAAFEVPAQWTTSNLSAKRFNLSGASVGSKALFAGGVASVANPLDTYYSVVDIYNANTSTWSTAQLSQARESMASATLGTKVFFAGGKNGATSSSVVDIYDDATGLWTTSSLSVGRQELAATSLAGKVFFGGGMSYQVAPYYSNVVDIYDGNTNSWSTSALSLARNGLAAAAAGSKVLFAGGVYNQGLSFSDRVDIYDVNTGLWTTATLSVGRGWLVAITIGTKIIFAGGRNYAFSPSEVSAVDIYDAATGQWSTASLSVGRSFLAAGASGNVAIFAGGYPPGSRSDVVDIYNATTGGWTTSQLSGPRASLTAAVVGDLILFAGGSGLGPPGSDLVDIYNTNPCNSSGLLVPSSYEMCAGSSVTITASGALSYSWTPSSTLSSPGGSSVTATPSQSTVYRLEAQMPSGCTAYTSVIVSVNPNPDVVIIASATTICKGASVSLGASGASTYDWSPSAGLSSTSGSNVTGTPQNHTTYTVLGTDIHGCSSQKDVTITVNPLPVVTVTASLTICEGASTLLTAGGANSYQWAPANSLSSSAGTSVTATPTNQTTYTVEGTNNNGCKNSVSSTVGVFHPARPAITVQLTGNSSITLASSALTGNQWYLGALPIAGAVQNTYVVSQNGLYRVKAMDGQCLSQLSDAVNIIGVSVVTNVYDQQPVGPLIFPNPVRQSATFSWDGFDKSMKVEIAIVDINGQVALASVLHPGQTVINLENLSGGIYQCRAQQSKRLRSTKFLKQ